METLTKNAQNAQGAQSNRETNAQINNEKIPTEQEVINHIKAVNQREKEVTKKVQVSITMLRELANNNELLELFITQIMDDEEDMKAPVAYQFAKAMLKQKKLKI